jgi:uroporphyrinogen decarboxylase
MKSITPILPRWEGSLTDRERFVRQMHYQTVDRCFNMEFGYWAENFKTWSIFVENNITNNAEADRFFNFDRIEVVSGRTWMHPPFKEEVISETEERKTIRNTDGLIVEIPKDSHSTIPHCIGSSITNPEDWKRCKEERFRIDDPARKIDVAKIKKQHPPDRDYPLGIHCGSLIGKIRDLLTVEGLAYACADYPEMVEDMVETVCLLIENVLDQLLPHIDFDFAAGWEDISCNNGPLVSMDFFKNVLVPRYKRIGTKLKSAGIDIWYTDSDGDIRPLIPLWLECGLNCMFPFEVKGSGHPAEVLNRYGKELRIMGGVDKNALRKGKEAIREYLESLVPLVERGGFIPFCDHRCPPDVTPENYLYYLNLKRELFGSA